MSKTLNRITYREAAKSARRLARECQEIADQETGERLKYWQSEATRHLDRASSYDQTAL